ncbi:helix-turn-helix transcriptional regulator [Rhodococcus sp. BP-252]|nr:helix-turn-helix transcriptional regulator [Rhodococcus sp. BP-320]MBY6419550.1 helix-turn-helix transcriptional regulator [Rhodococcus sp. BP-321]MBY6424208.1 helix-turn-helix transcriptional regulator [Rhodococcus sp. BP-324]MBY6429543.1 helix-turn-helix transcriptional regulator [Rhodococcus sp. BP-323]MBY6434392.1 helix-turn-helix transcriptional regulator [Rhodococcus sp. BP-322]MBY6443226.1 helix-turn-helix transcriptional regulator [Rhodococcus sp. BP-319]MBY6448024.1 helix-turn-hel
MRMFWERGYELTSISDLSRGLGISAPSLYAAFGDKQTLYAEAVARYEASPESITTAGTAGTSLRGVLEAMFDRASHEYASAEHPRGCLVNTEPKLAKNREQNRAITAARLRDVAGSGEGTVDADTVAAFAHVVLVGLSSYARDGASEQQLRDVAELALGVADSAALS